MIFNRPVSLYLAVITACLPLGVAFGLQWTGEQVAALTAALTAILYLVANVTTTPISNPELPAGTRVTVTNSDGTRVKHSLPSVKTIADGSVDVTPSVVPDTIVKHPDAPHVHPGD